MGGKSVFDTIAAAKYNPSGDGNFFKRGDYEVTIQTAKIITSADPAKKGDQFFIAECVIDKVVLAYEDSQKTGERASIVRNLTTDPWGFGVGDTKAFTAAALNVDIDALTSEDIAGALGGDGETLKGIPIQIHCARKAKKKDPGKTFDACQFAAMSDDMPSGEGAGE